MNIGLTESAEMPNFLDLLHVRTLTDVKPEAVTVIV
jgi:hypothetical protein